MSETENSHDVNLVFPNVSSQPELKEAINNYLNGNSENYVDIGLWDISRVYNMKFLFSKMIDTPEKNSLISGISEWKVGHVNLMPYMFEGCTEFNQPLNGWDVSNVINMKSMFEDCYKFNQPLDQWDVSKVKYMTMMFSNCREFNQDLTEWYVESDVYTEYMFDGCDSMTIIPSWSLPASSYPKSRDTSIPSAPTTLPPIIAGVNFPDGLDLTEPFDVDPFDPNTMNRYYWKPQADITKDFLKTLTKYEKMIIDQYVNTDCYFQEVDCYVGNRLTTYLLTIHPEIIQRYPQYQNILFPEDFSVDSPVVFGDRYITEEKILAILRSFRELNLLLKRFPPLDANTYPNGFYLYRGKRYEGEIENLSLGEQFVLSKLTSTSMDVRFSANNFAAAVNTRYKNDRTLVTRPLAFLWRIKMPLGLPFAYIHEWQKEVVLPIGTKLRFLGCHVQLAGPNSIFKSVTEIGTTNYEGDVYGALICEFEILEIIEGPLLSVLADTVKRDFATGNSAIYASDLTIPGDWDKFLRKKEILPDDAFGKRRTKKNKRRTNKRRTNKRRTNKRKTRRRIK